MATIRKTKLTSGLTTGKPGVKLMDAPPPDSQTHLRVANIAHTMLAVPENRNSEGASIFLVAWEEDILPAKAWTKDRNLRKCVEDGKLAVGWAYETDSPRRLPSLDEAPEECRAINGAAHKEFDQTYALSICLQSDLKKSLDDLNVTVISEDTQRVDARFMKERFDPLLRMVKWLEPQIQNRKPVLAAVGKRLSEIRAL